MNVIQVNSGLEVNSTHSQPRHLMISGLFHAPAKLPPKIEPPVSLNRRLGEPRNPSGRFEQVSSKFNLKKTRPDGNFGTEKGAYGGPRITEKSLAPARHQTTVSRLFSPYVWRKLLLVKITTAHNVKY